MDLSLPISSLPGVGPTYAKRLTKLEINTIEDFLYHIPFRYQDFSEISKIAQFPIGEIATIKGDILDFKNLYTKQGRKIQLAEIYDGTGKIAAIWFNQPFLANTIKPGETLSMSGKLAWWKKQKALYGPEYEILTDGADSIHTGRLVPVYPATYGISPKWIRGKMHYLLKNLAQVNDYFSTKFCEDNALINLDLAIRNIHFPPDLQSADIARKRLAFDELLFIHLQNIYRRIDWQKNVPTNRLSINKPLISQFISSLPFELTESQSRSIEEILKDFSKPTPMNRLLEGDVGSGKTIVAATAAYAAYLNNYQSIFMAPTQILAEQHYKTLQKVFEPFNIGVGLLTSGQMNQTRGLVHIWIGTHALIHNRIAFDKVAMVVIDEQHRFGVEQRAHLVQKTLQGQVAPHVLTMTATPIPRTIALTLYGELDLSTLDELPSGRIPTKTWPVPPAKREAAYEWIKQQLIQEKIQVFVVCPLIEESESETAKSAKSALSEFEKLKKIFKQFSVGLLHGRMKATEKTSALEAFREGKIDILVTTPVVEVGVDIPNANIMLIETAERFGLAQLHQLRGRVGRGQKQSYCLLFTENDSDKVTNRLSALKETLSGAKLAEYDLKLRGPGEVLGTRQHGVAELKIANWLDIDLIKQTKSIAKEVIQKPSEYKLVLDRFHQKIIIDN